MTRYTYSHDTIMWKINSFTSKTASVTTNNKTNNINRQKQRYYKSYKLINRISRTYVK